MNKRDLNFYKENKIKEWKLEVENEIEKLNKKLNIIIFLEGWNKLENLLDKNPILCNCEIILEGILKNNNYDDYEVLEESIKITENGKKIENNRLKIEIEYMFKYKLEVQSKEDEYKIKINLKQSKEQIREELAKVYLNESEKIEYDYFVLNRELEPDENKKNKQDIRYKI